MAHPHDRIAVDCGVPATILNRQPKPQIRVVWGTVEEFSNTAIPADRTIQLLVFRSSDT